MFVVQRNTGMLGYILHNMFFFMSIALTAVEPLLCGTTLSNEWF